ncbi:MAG: tRNA 2-thiouridine(34) synthase MnmA [Clostridiales bacterium]|nr:tRNA 2-thiouridine(34) synthase MnmA [Clostridiales bacterium]
MTNPKVLVGMSGGVDSSVAVLLMLRSGYTCIGATMRLYNNEDIGLEESRTCCSLEDVEDARSVARRLGIPHYVFNFRDDFEENVISRFVQEYERGLTPNPCIDCNRYLKFDHLLRRALELECDCVVTGHYARIRQDAETGRYLLLTAADADKDQTYFLYTLTQHQLAHTQFPLGELTKTQVRQLAQENGLVTARKRDSQDICFVPDGDYVAFLERYTGKHYPCGPFLDAQGNTVGTHRGAVAYTIGQRRGLGLAMGEPVYVCGKDMRSNTVTVGPSEMLFHRSLIAGDCNWIPFPALPGPMAVTAKTRHTRTGSPATATPLPDSRVRVDFETPQRAITPGQAVVLYKDDLVLGGGTIEASM